MTAELLMTKKNVLAGQLDQATFQIGQHILDTDAGEQLS
jgi:hypothetical protein